MAAIDHGQTDKYYKCLLQGKLLEDDRHLDIDIDLGAHGSADGVNNEEADQDIDLHETGIEPQEDEEFMRALEFALEAHDAAGG